MKQWLVALACVGLAWAEPESLSIPISSSPSGARVWLSQLDREVDTGQTTGGPVRFERSWFFDQNRNPVSRTFVLRLPDHAEARFKTSWGNLHPETPLLAENGQPFRLEALTTQAWLRDHPGYLAAGGAAALVLAGLGLALVRRGREARLQREAAEAARRKAQELEARQQAQQQEAARQAQEAAERTAVLRQKEQELEEKHEAIQASGGKDRWIGSEVVSRPMGTYVVQRRLGEGGMGSVYEGKLLSKNPGSPERMALKITHADGDRERAVSEGQMGMQLVHPGIVRCYDYVEMTEAICLFLELVEGGQDLSHLLARGAMEPARALKMLAGPAKALDAMHEKGYIHRDLKPANVMLTQQGELKIADLGLAKNPLAQFQTQTAVTMGTAAYMAPEQVMEFKSVTGAADQYALGCILYQMIEGKLPFEEADMLMYLNAHLTKTPAAPVQVSGAAGLALLRMLEKDPVKRYGGCFEALATVNSQLNT